MGAARWARLGGILALLLVLYFAIPTSAEVRGGPVLRAVLGGLVLAALAVAVTAQVRLAAHDQDRRIDGLVTSIVSVWIAFAFAFFVLDLKDPTQLSGLGTHLDALYFSASTMLTIGYGDIHASGQAARTLVLVQMVFDVVFVAAAVTVLTSRIRRRAQGSAPGHEPTAEPGP